MDEPSAASTLGPLSSPETSQLEHLTSGQCTPLDTEMPLLKGVAVEMETLVPVIKVENDYYFDLQQTGPSGDLHSIAESILEATVASNYSIYAPRGAAPMTPYNVATLAALREWDGGQPFLLVADSAIVKDVLDRESAHGEYGGPDIPAYSSPKLKALTQPRKILGEIAKAAAKPPWMKRWIVLFGGWIGLFLNGFLFNSSTLLIPFIDAHSANAGTGVLCVTMLNTAWMVSGGIAPIVTNFLGVRITMLIFSLSMSLLLLVSSMTTAPFGLYACFFAMGVTSSIVYICSLSVQTQYFPGKLLGVSYGLTQTGWGLGVILFSSVLHLVPIQLYPNVVYMSCSFLAGAGVLSAMLLDQREPEQYRAFGRKCLGDLQARWRRKGTETVGEYAHMTANSTTKMNSMVELETVIAKGDMKGELSAKASPNSFSGTFCHTSVVYLLLASFFFAAHHLGVVTTLTRLMVARKHPDGAAASLQAYFAADLIMRAPTGVLLAKVGEFRTMFGVYVLGVCLSIAIAYAEDLNLLVALSAALGAMSAASIVAFNAVAPVVVGYEHATQLLGISYTVVWTLPALTVMPIISLAHPVDLDYKWTFVTCGICSLCAAACTGMSWFYSNRRGSQIHPQVALDAWVLVPVPIVDDMHITDRRYSEIVDEE